MLNSFYPRNNFIQNISNSSSQIGNIPQIDHHLEYGNIPIYKYNLYFMMCLLSVIYVFDTNTSYLEENIQTASASDVHSLSHEFWWEREHYTNIYKFELSNQGRLASAYITVLIHHAIRANDMKFLNSFFYKINKNNLTSWSLIALLRSTNVYKNDIKEWKSFYFFTKNIVEQEGKNPDKELYGLDRGLFV